MLRQGKVHAGVAGAVQMAGARFTKAAIGRPWFAAKSFVTATAIPAPHSKIAATSNSERFALSLFDQLWETYRSRVSYVNVYEGIVANAGATFFNDHIALRSLAMQDPCTGIFTTSRVFEALGYRAAECYSFEDKHLGAIYYQHPHPHFPKLFISELRVPELSATARELVESAASCSYRSLVTADLLSALRKLDTASSKEQADVLQATVEVFHSRPWRPPSRSDVETLHKETQYGAWVLVHGNNVNHFTALINSHKVPQLDTIEKTAAALTAAGVPMKPDIEGEAGSHLRQTATTAVKIACRMSDGGEERDVDWPYAYFELAQRDVQADGRRFEGFFSSQATNLFEMTK